MSQTNSPSPGFCASISAAINTIQPTPSDSLSPVKISEAGRKHLGGLLSRLSDAQLEALFRSARFDRPTGLVFQQTTPISEWVRVFKSKVKQVTDGPSCPQ